MGCNASKQAVKMSVLSRIDDSVHVMLEHDTKMAARRGEQPRGYVPRQPHPAFSPIQAREEEDDDTTVDEVQNALEEEQAKLEAERVLWHAKHHCDTVDPRDAKMAGMLYSPTIPVR